MTTPTPSAPQEAKPGIVYHHAADRRLQDAYEHGFTAGMAASTKHAQPALDAAREENERLKREVEELKDLREGDNKLIRALAEDVGIKITAPDKLLGAQWEQFHAGVLALRLWSEQVRKAMELAKEDHNTGKQRLSTIQAINTALQSHPAATKTEEGK